MIRGALLLAIEPLRLLGRHLERDDEQSSLILWVGLVQASIEPAVICTWRKELRLGQRVGFDEKVVFDHIANLSVDAIWDESDFAVKGTNFDTMCLP